MKKLLILTLFLSACKKDHHTCEIWLTQRMCYPKKPNVVCFTNDPIKITICDAKRLDDAHHGRETVGSDGPDAKLTHPRL